MRIHRLNCITSRLPGGRLVDGAARGLFERGRCVNHCLVAETGEGLLLVDTGLGMGDVLDPEQRLSTVVRSLLVPELDPEMTATRQIERMGYRPDDVRDIVLTHLDFDAAGGLDDFPRARVHVRAAEVEHARAQKTWGTRSRFRPSQWSTRNRWIIYENLSDSSWMGLRCIRNLTGLPPEVVLVPLPGHTPGHCGVAIRAEERWYLHAGDAYFDARELDADPQCRLGLQLYEAFTQTHRRARVATQRMLRTLHAEHPEIVMSCSHDVRDFERLAGRPAHVPPDPIAERHDAYTGKVVRTKRPLEIAPRSVPGIEVGHHDVDVIDYVPVVRQADAPRRPRS